MSMRMRCGPYSIAICDDGRQRVFKMRTVESVASDDDERARSADLQSGCPVPPLTTTAPRIKSTFLKSSFFGLPLESWLGIVLQVAEEEFHSRLSLLFYFSFKKCDLKHDYIQEDAP